MHLEATVSHSMKGGLEHLFGVSTLSEGIHSVYEVHVHTLPTKKHDIMVASCGNIRHHMMMSGIMWQHSGDVGDFRS